jgi:hypothetical protein
MTDGLCILTLWWLACVCYAQVLTLMGRAQHDANEHMAARRALARAMHMFPTDLKLRFNMAFVLQVRNSGWAPVHVFIKAAWLSLWHCTWHLHSQFLLHTHSQGH